MNVVFLGATKVTDKGDEYEIRVGRLNRTIAGSCTPKRRPAKQTIVDTFKVAMTNAFMEQQIEVRKFTSDELAWSEIVKHI